MAIWRLSRRGSLLNIADGAEPAERSAGEFAFDRGRAHRAGRGTEPPASFECTHAPDTGRCTSDIAGAGRLANIGKDQRAKPGRGSQCASIRPNLRSLPPPRLFQAWQGAPCRRGTRPRRRRRASSHRSRRPAALHQTRRRPPGRNPPPPKRNLPAPKGSGRYCSAQGERAATDIGGERCREHASRGHFFYRFVVGRFDFGGAKIAGERTILEYAGAPPRCGARLPQTQPQPAANVTAGVSPRRDGECHAGQPAASRHRRFRDRFRLRVTRTLWAVPPRQSPTKRPSPRFR